MASAAMAVFFFWPSHFTYAALTAPRDVAYALAFVVATPAFALAPPLIRYTTGIASAVGAEPLVTQGPRSLSFLRRALPTLVASACLLSATCFGDAAPPLSSAAPPPLTPPSRPASPANAHLWAIRPMGPPQHRRLPPLSLLWLSHSSAAGIHPTSTESGLPEAATPPLSTFPTLLSPNRRPLASLSLAPHLTLAQPPPSPITATGS